MARAKVIGQVSGKPGWYLVEDHLGVRYEAQSGVDGFDFQPGEEYRVFAPGGQYRTGGFRLLPYKTSMRWRSARELAATHPATAAALYLYADKMRQHLPQDREATVKEVQAERLVFHKGGYAKITPDEESYYQPGDTVAVIHDQPSDGPSCLRSGRRDRWVAGFAGSQPPRPKAASASGALCNPFYERWNGYPSSPVDFLAPVQSVPGASYLIKQSPLPGEAEWWYAQAANNYVSLGMPYGQPGIINAGNRLTMEAQTFAFPYPASLGEVLWYQQNYPSPMIMLDGTAQTMLVSPPVAAHTSARRNVVCHGKPLTMRLNLLTEDTHGWYQATGVPQMGISIPACVVLVFAESPYPKYLSAGNVNQSWVSNGYGWDKHYASVDEVQMKQKFKLVYSAPGAQDFGFARTAHPQPSAPGQFALARAFPRYREVWGGGSWFDYAAFRTKFNVPMDDAETGFGGMGQLLTRCFDADGTDITPPWSQIYYADLGGFFPGYFEIPSGSDTQRDIRQDFLAAYPFMGNPKVNPSGNLPRLKEIWFYAQGRIAQSGYRYVPNPTRLVCKLLELFY